MLETTEESSRSRGETNERAGRNVIFLWHNNEGEEAQLEIWQNVKFIRNPPRIQQQFFCTRSAHK